MVQRCKKILFVNKTAPYGTSNAQEALDILLMASTFEQDISVLFLDDGVFQLQRNQDTKLLDLKNFSVTYKAFPLYDIKKVYVEKTALKKRCLAIEDLIIPANLLSNEEVTHLLAQQDIIFNF